MKPNIIKAISGGASAIVIASLMLGGHDGLEGRRYTPYYDVANVLTVCDGHTGPDIVKDKRYSDFECDTLLANDLGNVAKQVDPLIHIDITEQTRAAMYSFVYNVGITAFTKSTLLALLNQNDIPGACDQLHRWVYAGGKRWKGLISRREVEFLVCSYPQEVTPPKADTPVAVAAAVNRATDTTGHKWLWWSVIGAITFFIVLAVGFYIRRNYEYDGRE